MELDSWRVPYRDSNNIKKWANFKKEIDAQNFVKKLKK